MHNYRTEVQFLIHVFMHSGVTYFIAITLNKNAHRSIAYNTIIVVINILYKLKDMC